MGQSMKAKLVVVQGKPLGREIQLHKGQFLIGRGKDCQLRPNSELVSRHHCCITRDESGVRAKEMGSTNGTFLNGKQVTEEMMLTNGDLLTIGPLTFAVVISGPKPATVAQPAGPAVPTIGAERTASDDELVEWLSGEEEQETTAGTRQSDFAGTTMVIDKSQVPDTDLTMAQNGEDDEKTAEKRAKQETRILPSSDERTTADAAGDLMRKYFQRPGR